jgi:hypothetical protein
MLDGDGVLTTLHSFGGSDGARPLAGLTLGADGSLYGTTASGGRSGPGGVEYGVIFRLHPGRGGMRLPGDCNADGARDISDALCLLGFLFFGSPRYLPCDSGEPDERANLELLDLNGDERIDLSDPISLLGFLFLGRPAARSGEECEEIIGCSAACFE